MAYSTGTRSNPPITISDGSGYDTEWSPDLDAEDLRELEAAEENPDKIVSALPRESSRLGYYSTICLTFNRMIGTGIFNSAAIVFTNTQSIGISIILWVLGAILALSGVIVYIELGLTIPRWPFGPNGEKISTPRSGEALNYFNYLLKKPLFLATCLFGITFIVLENTAANSVSFAQNVLDAAGVKVYGPGKIIAIALGANTFSCVLHAISRKWGIRLNNFFGTVKFFILIFIVIIGLIYINHDIARDNFDPKTSFSTLNRPRMPYRYAEAFLFVIYPYGAFHQINYVISKLDQPRKTFPRASWYGVLTIAILYTAVNITYAAIIPKAQLFSKNGIDVGKVFFELTLGKATSIPHVHTIFSTIKAFSAIGNIIVVTFTAARVKQEIAKEGILPYSLFFAQSYDFSLGRIFGRHRPTADVNSMYSEKTPVATLAMHWVFTTIMVVGPVLAIQPEVTATTLYSPTAAFSFLATVFAYDINVAIFTGLSLGLLCLRFAPNVKWAEKSEYKHPIISVIAASMLFVGSVFPLIFIWIPDPKFPKLSRSNNLVSWYAAPVTGLGLVGFSFIYWLCFRGYVAIRSARGGKTLHVRREPKFKHDTGGLTQILEIVTLEWKREVGLRLDEIEETDDGFKRDTASQRMVGSMRRRHFGGSEASSGREGAHEMAQRGLTMKEQRVQTFELPVPSNRAY